eukprot:6937198-Prymnesium_polylepis.2
MVHRGQGAASQRQSCCRDSHARHSKGARAAGMGDTQRAGMCVCMGGGVAVNGRTRVPGDTWSAWHIGRARGSGGGVKRRR